MRRALNNLNDDLVQAISRLCLPGHLRRGQHRPRPSEQVSGARNADARDPHHVAIADDRRRCPDVQEHRPCPRRQLDDRVQADHRARHSRARRLRQALLQHPRLHRFGDAPVRRSATSTATRFSNRAGNDGDGRNNQRDDDGRNGGCRISKMIAGRRSQMTRKACGGNTTSMAVRSRSPRIWSMSLIPMAGNCASSSSPNTRRRKCARSILPRPICGSSGPTRRSRAEIIAKLEERGIDFDQLRSTSNQPEADPFDLLCHLAFNGPLRTRRERADRVKKEEKIFFEKYGPEARAILDRSFGKIR